jgi:hypothetical protein
MTFFPFGLIDTSGSGHAFPAWLIPYFTVFVMFPVYLLEAFGVPPGVSSLPAQVELAFVNGVLWMVLAALVFFVKTAAGKRK